MRNKKIGQAEPALEVAQKVDDLRLDGNVKSRYGFIAYDEFRFNGQGACNADALALTA